MDNESVEFDFHENLDQFYPGLRRDTHKEDGLVEGDKSIIFHPNEGFYSKYGKIATRDWRGKRCKFFKNNDPRVNINLNFSDATFRSMDTLISKLSEKLSDDMPFGVRSIHTPKTGTEIRSLQDLQHGRAYVCREVNKPRALNLSKVQNMQIENWTNKKPLTSQEDHSLRISGKYLDGWWFEQKMKSGRSSSESKQMGFKPRSPKDEEVKSSLSFLERCVQYYEMRVEIKFFRNNERMILINCSDIKISLQFVDIIFSCKCHSVRKL